MHALLLALPEGEVERDGQLEQVAEPTDALYLPTVQLVHGPPSGPLEPALHVHALLLALPEGEVERDGQLEQSAEPDAPCTCPPCSWYTGLRQGRWSRRCMCTRCC